MLHPCLLATSARMEVEVVICTLVPRLYHCDEAQRYPHGVTPKSPKALGSGRLSQMKNEALEAAGDRVTILEALCKQHMGKEIVIMVKHYIDHILEFRRVLIDRHKECGKKLGFRRALIDTISVSFAEMYALGGHLSTYRVLP
ncbi:hypothetical protein VNO78_25900 [Psophocarpus tetragonolobus]|uniref:Uncharacterized protein n=1 Tax=Psophocarpus tetragonolobus TaxID=3891 RepID=A0AAN9S7S1_PSOTE